MLKAFIHIKVTEQHNDEVEDQDEQIMGILKYCSFTAILLLYPYYSIVFVCTKFILTFP